MPRHGLATPGDPHEQVIGPVHGYYFACYTLLDAEGYHGYAKLCAERPLDVWDTPGATVKVASGPYAHPEQALVGVVSRARRQLERRVHDMLWLY
jgi:hypothetical protein